MKKLFGEKTQITVFILVLMVVSIACNYPDAVEVIAEAAIEKCETVSRDSYEIAAKTLGQTPETPNDPASAVYEVCYQKNNPNPVSVRMYGDYQSDAKNTIPAGTYTGETNFDMVLDSDIDDSYLEPICSENTIQVVIGSDGAAQGEIRAICYANQSTDKEDMRMTLHADITGIPQGELLGNAGQLSIAYTSHTYITSPQWETPSLDKTIDYVFPYHVNVFENVMTLTPAAEVEDYYSFTLRKE
jgi:hypothetical protein